MGRHGGAIGCLDDGPAPLGTLAREGPLALEGVAGTAPADLRAAVDRLGTRFDSPYTFSTRFGAGRHDGAAAWRPLAYDEGCQCFRYRGAVTPLG